MGRNAAGESFLSGFLTNSTPSERLWVQVHERADAKQFVESARTLGCNQPISVIDYSSISANKNSGLLYYPGPDICDQARYRSLHGGALWSICGITHTTSSLRAMDSITDWLTEPVEEWDAVICTSNAVKSNVENILQARIEELKQRLGIARITVPKLPVIPLGLDTQRFSFTEKDKNAARAKFGIPHDAITILYAGRLSFHAKANPVQMYSCLESAASATKQKIYLIESGWFANESIEAAFEEAARHLCPSITRLPVDGRNKDNHKNAWAAADIFCSLSDNIQETFGIVPLEAMASGLPLIVTDWDGYRDTVRDGVDGFRVPTISPRAGLGADLAYHHATGVDSYDMYCGNNSNLVSVSESALRNAFVELIGSSSLRSKFGDSGKEHVRDNYDWKTIIPRYEELWSELATIRKASLHSQVSNHARDGKDTRGVWPARLDPTLSFGQYPTAQLTENTVFTIWTGNFDLAFGKYKKQTRLRMVNYTNLIIPAEDEVKQVIINATASHPEPATADRLLYKVSALRKPYVLRSLAWLCKIGILEFK